jgi:hypothetical protein
MVAPERFFLVDAVYGLINSNNSSMRSTVRSALSDARVRIESTFQSIGVLLDQLSTIAAAFNGQLLEDASGNNEFGAYSERFLDSLGKFGTQFEALRHSCRDIKAHAMEADDQLPDILDHCIHLRSCTFTLKVISARYPEILGFAEEMAHCVLRIRTSADALKARLIAIVAVEPAEMVEGGAEPPQLDKAHIEPAFIRAAIEELHQSISHLMSSLQCGDIASQRLDHVIQMVDMVEAAALSDEDRARFLGMVSAQLDQTLKELSANCEMFTENFGQLAKLLEHLTEDASLHHLSSIDSYSDLQHQLERFFDRVRGQLKQHELHVSGFSSNHVNAIDDSISSDIFAIESAVLEIYYMALNTTLSCGRLGGSATSAAPVTSEIRYRVQHLGASADAMSALAPPLTTALRSCAGMQVETDLEEVFSDEHGRLSAQVAAMIAHANEMWLKPKKLNDIARVLLAEIPRLRDVAAGSATAQEQLSYYHVPEAVPIFGPQAVEQLSEQIFALYTMNSERELHKKHFNIEVDSSDISAVSLFDEGEDEEVSLSAVLF